MHNDIDGDQLDASSHEPPPHEQTTQGAGDTDVGRSSSSPIDCWHFTKGVKDNEGPDMMDIVEEGGARARMEQGKRNDRDNIGDECRKLHARDRARFPVVYDSL